MEYVKGEPSAFFKNVSANSFDDLTLESTSQAAESKWKVN